VYGKLFQSLYQGTMRGQADLILVFTNLLAFKDKDQIVDKHPRCIAEEVGIPEERVRAAILELEAPDPESRTEAHEGRRLIRMDDHRSWGWFVVNGEKYDKIRNAEERRAQNRESQARKRELRKIADSQISSANVTNGQQPSAESAPIAIAITRARKNKSLLRLPTQPKTSEEIIAAYSKLSEFSSLNVPEEYKKFQKWYEGPGKPQPTQRRFLRWLKTAAEDAPIVDAKKPYDLVRHSAKNSYRVKYKRSPTEEELTKFIETEWMQQS